MEYNSAKQHIGMCAGKLKEVDLRFDSEMIKSLFTTSHNAPDMKLGVNF